MKTILSICLVLLLFLTTGCGVSSKKISLKKPVPVKVSISDSKEFKKKLTHLYHSAAKNKNLTELLTFLNSTMNDPKLKLNIRRQAYVARKIICPAKGGIVDTYSDEIGLGLSITGAAPTPLKPILGGASVGLDLCQEDYVGAALGVGAIVNPLLVPVDIASQVIKMKFL